MGVAGVQTLSRPKKSRLKRPRGAVFHRRCRCRGGEREFPGSCIRHRVPLHRANNERVPHWKWHLSGSKERGSHLVKEERDDRGGRWDRVAGTDDCRDQRKKYRLVIATLRRGDALKGPPDSYTAAVNSPRVRGLQISASLRVQNSFSDSTDGRTLCFEISRLRSSPADSIYVLTCERAN